MLINEEEIMQLLSQKLKPKRLEHSVNVAKRAEYLAELYQYDKRIAKMTGLLHDVCKNDNFDIMLQTIANSGIILTTVERQSPPLYHAIAGAAFVKDVLKIKNDDMIHAIRYHTTGRAGMSLLEKIIFTADLTEEGRGYPDVETVRTLADRSLDQAVLYILRYTLGKLLVNSGPLCRDTWAAYNQLALAQITEKTSEKE